MNNQQIKQLNILIDKIKSCDAVLIGYSFKFEKIKDSLLKYFKANQINDIDNFSIKSFDRNQKIDFLFDNKDILISKCFYCDLEELKTPCVSKDYSYYTYSKPILENLREKFLHYTDYKLFITSPVNSYKDSSMGFTSMIPLMLSDLAIIISDNKIKVIKDRNSLDKFEIDI